MTTLTAEKRLTETSQDIPHACEATNIKSYGETSCAIPATGRFVRACEHEHVRQMLLCEQHAQRAESGLCRDCLTLPEPLAHHCKIVIVQLEVFR